jgi:hypothetical protein
LPEEPQAEEQKKQPPEKAPKKPKVELPTESTDLVVSQTVKLGNITVEITPQGLERFLVDNDASQLAGNAQTRALYYLEMCRRYGVDPFTQPFDWIPGSDGKGLTLYPNKEFAAQRRKKSGISCTVLESGVMPSDGTPGPQVYFVRMQGKTIDGRVDEEIGVVPFTDAMGRPIDPMSKSNAMKRAFTQAKRRVTLSLEGCGADEPSRGYNEDTTQSQPSQPRVITPPTRLKAAPKAPELPAEAASAPAAVLEASPIVVEAQVVPEPAKVPAVAPVPQRPQITTQPGPPSAPTPAPAVTVVGKRAIYIPKR